MKTLFRLAAAAAGTLVIAAATLISSVAIAEKVTKTLENTDSPDEEKPEEEPQE
jgi:hypothetical protein